MKSSRSSTLLSSSATNRTGTRSGFIYLPQLHVPGPRRVFHLKYIAILSVILGFTLLLLHLLWHQSNTQKCSEEGVIDKYIEAQRVWLKVELNNIVSRIAHPPKENLRVDKLNPDDANFDGDAIREDDENDEYKALVSESVVYEVSDVMDGDYDQPNDENEQPDNLDGGGQMSLNMNQEQVAELKLWKKMEKENLPGIFRDLRRVLNGTIDKLIPAPGTVAHDEKRPFMILSSVNAGFLDFTVNWLMSMKQIGIRYNVTLISEDPVAYEYLSKRYKRSSTIHIVPTNKSYTTSKVLGFFSKEYLQLVNRRAEYMLNFLEKGIDVLHADVDEYWFRDPLTFIRAEYDIYDVWSSQGKDGPCPCFLYLKAKSNVISMVKDWSLRIIRKQGQENDQQALAHVMWRYRVMPYSNNNKIFHKKLGHDLFPTGTVFFTPSWWRLNGKRLYVAHANRLGNHEKKTAFFREYRLWLVNPYKLDLPVISES